MTSWWRDSVSNHQPHYCLLNRLFRRRSKKTSKLRVTGRCAGNSPGPVNSPYKWPVTRKRFPFDDVIMQVITYIWSEHLYRDWSCQPWRCWWHPRLLLPDSIKTTLGFRWIMEISHLYGHFAAIFKSKPAYLFQELLCRFRTLNFHGDTRRLHPRRCVHRVAEYTISAGKRN